MKLRIYESDIEGEAVKALFNESEQELITCGDYYHDKIDERIQGILLGFDYLDKEYQLLEEQFINEDNKMYSICLFDKL
jgi:hypothetical protein